MIQMKNRKNQSIEKKTLEQRVIVASMETHLR